MWSSRRKPEFPRKGQKNWNIGLAKRALSHDSQHQLHSVPPSAGTDQPPAVPHADDPKKPYNPNALYVKKLYWGVAIEGDVHEQVDELTLYKRMAQSGTAWAILHQKMVKAKVDKQKIAVVEKLHQYYTQARKNQARRGKKTGYVAQNLVWNYKYSDSREIAERANAEGGEAQEGGRSGRTGK